MPETTLNDMTARLRVMQIIAAALIVGVLFFAGITVAQTLDKPPGEPFLAYLAAGFAVMQVMLWGILPTVISCGACRQMRRTTDLEETGRTSALVGIYQTKMIVAMALLEGAAFFNLIAYLVCAYWWSLAVAGGLTVLMVTGFPTRFRVDSWIETQQQAFDWES